MDIPGKLPFEYEGCRYHEVRAAGPKVSPSASVSRGELILHLHLLRSYNRRGFYEHPDINVLCQ